MKHAVMLVLVTTRFFLPEGKEKAFAEMEADEKNEISHRGRAVAKLVDYLKKN